ncbi:MAG: hypothetical protein JKY31_03195 [Rhodobacteraceae bacterium]|nr:hypothetical protein [Paracoccaceae bacterium]
MKKIDIVISVCSIQHIEVWKITSKEIIRNIPASRYRLFVPDDDLDAFKEISPDEYEILGDSSIIGDLKNRLLSKMPASQHFRVGWYLQQFIKLTAIHEATDGDVILIWDADTVPLKQLEFIAPDGALSFYTGKENHAPYFDNIAATLNLEKIVDYSFIAQCFPIRGEWAHAFFSYVEEHCQTDWLDGLINKIDFTQSAGFSEYETLGTFLTHNYKDYLNPLPNQWLRKGASAVGGLENLETALSKFVLRRYDFVSFENWDTLSFWKLLKHRLMIGPIHTRFSKRG